MTVPAWNAFEHRIWSYLKEDGDPSEKSYILAVSGGLDSMVLLSVFARLLPKAKVYVAHYHHGPTEEESLAAYREQAMQLVKKKARQLGYEFVFQKSQSPLRSEEQLRNARWGFLNKVTASSSAVVVTGHHLGDYFETYLLKMIRGTSLEGVKTFQMRQKGIFRPLLNCTKDELQAYALERQLEWIEDPSNADDHYLRNWLRNQWLPTLEQKVPGAVDNLAKSLFKIAQSASGEPTLELVLGMEDNQRGMNRMWFMALSKSEQLRALALFLKKHQIYQFTSGQLEEIRKRLDKNQKDFTFEILRRKWVINASQIVLQ